MNKTVRLVITGRVQNVGFRDWLVARARAAGLDGFVQNLPDRSVEALLSGDAAAVDAVIALCRRGPASARVDAIAITPATPPPSPGFERV